MLSVCRGSTMAGPIAFAAPASPMHVHSLHAGPAVPPCIQKLNQGSASNSRGAGRPGENHKGTAGRGQEKKSHDHFATDVTTIYGIYCDWRHFI